MLKYREHCMDTEQEFKNDKQNKQKWYATDKINTATLMFRTKIRHLV